MTTSAVESHTSESDTPPAARVAVVTGGAPGLRRATAVRLAER